MTGRFDGGRISSDAGGVLLREVDKRTGLTARVSRCWVDYRNPASVEHSVHELVSQRLYAIALGYEDLNDHDDSNWPNLGRHPLGATAVGRNKALALAERLQADYPHLQIEGRACGLHHLLQSDVGLLEAADLIVAATGSWSAESALNRWHVGHGRPRPILYGWTEAHACAGHAVAIAGEGGCFQCNIGRTGAPSFKVVDWPDGGDGSQEEPACGAHYHPYGPVELSYVTAVIGDVALECLFSPPARSFSRVFVASQRRVVQLGARWSDEWLGEHGNDEPGIRTVDRPWLRTTCPACRDQPAEEAA